MINIGWMKVGGRVSSDCSWSAGSMGERKRFPCHKGSYGEGQGPKGGGKNRGSTNG